MVLETYTRVFVDADALDRTSAFYRSLLAGEETLRFAYPEAHLELAAVSSRQLSVLIIAGSAEARCPFETTRLTIKVDVLEPVLEILARRALSSWSRCSQLLSVGRLASNTSTG
jgi:hypothetical protein